MKITGLKTYFSGSNHYIRITTDEGISGLGECTLNSRQMAVEGALSHLAPVLTGRNPGEIERIWQEVFRGTFWRGGPVLQSALSAVDMALWDIKGKALNTPVYNLLGGRCRDKLALYAALRGRTPEALAEDARRKTDAGYRILRMCVEEIGEEQGIYDPGKIVRRSAAFFRAVRQAVGDDIEVIFECHTRLSPVRAVEQANRIAEFHPLFVEDPIRADSPEAFRYLRSHTQVPLGTGEKLGALWDYRTLIEEDLIDYLRTDICNCGGISAMRKIAAYGEAHYLEMVPHGVPHLGFLAAMQVDFATPNFCCQEDWFSGAHPAHLDYEARFEDGYLIPSDRPGLGVELLEDRLEPYRSYEHPHWQRPDGSVQDW